MLLYKPKKNQALKGSRFLISITVLGSAGPIRFVVNEHELVATVIDNALKLYAREGRLPVLGSDLNSFMLYCPISGTEALCPWVTIGSVGFRNFVLCKKPQTEKSEEDDKSPTVARKGSGSWKAWFNKSINADATQLRLTSEESEAAGKSSMWQSFELDNTDDI